MREKLTIRHTENGVLCVSLNDILSLVSDPEKYFWNLIWIQASSNPKYSNIIEFEKMINHSKNGYMLSWSDLKKIESFTNQIIELVVIGDADIGNLKRVENDKVMQTMCNFFIELVDSSYWEIYTNDSTTITNIKRDLQNYVSVIISDS